MKFGILILAFALYLTPFIGFAQEIDSKNDKKHFCSFLDSMNYPSFYFTHSEFAWIVEMAKKMKHVKLPSRFRHYSMRTVEDGVENFTFEYKSNLKTDSIRRGRYSINLIINNDSVVDFYHQFPPDANAKIVGNDILEIYLNMIQFGNNFFQLQEYGNSAFKAGMQIAENYREILNEFFVSEPGLYNSKKVDRFVLLSSEDYNEQNWIELDVDKKSKLIKSFVAIKYR